MARDGKRVRYVVTRDSSEKGGWVFKEVASSSGKFVKVMNRRVMDDALDGADRKLREVIEKERRSDPAA